MLHLYVVPATNKYKVFRDGLYNIKSDRQSCTLLNMKLLVQHIGCHFQNFGPSVQSKILQILWTLAFVGCLI